MTFLFSTWLRAKNRKAAIGAHCGANRRRPHRVALRLEALEDRTVPSTFTVTNNSDTGVAGDGSLRGEILAASSGDTINFDASLAGQTITLTNGELAITQNLDIEGLGANQLTVSGNNASRVFDISAGANVTIAGMTITDGLANGSAPVFTSSGGAILDLGTLTLSNDAVSNNEAVGDASKSPTGRPGGALGGALANFGTGMLTISSCSFANNLALGADGSSGPSSAGNAIGGAIANGIVSFATATITDSQFTFNVAQAGSNESGSMDATAAGGGINNTGSLTIASSTFSHNQAIGGNDSLGTVRPGLGVGGAISSGGPAGPAAMLLVSTSTFDHNQAISGNGNQSSSNPAPSLLGPNDAFGGGIHFSGGTATLSGCTIEHNSAIAGAGIAEQNGGLAVGGGMDVSNLFNHGLSVTVSDCTFDHNAATGGAGGNGGNGGEAWGGGLAILKGATLAVSNSTVDDNHAFGGAGGSGGNGGNGLGGGIYEDAGPSLAPTSLTLMGDTIDNNHAIRAAHAAKRSKRSGAGKPLTSLRCVRGSEKSPRSPLYRKTAGDYVAGEGNDGGSLRRSRRECGFCSWGNSGPRRC
jgi:hypothetical protein